MPHCEFFCHASFFESPVPSRLRRGRSFVPALRQQESGPLVRLFHHHLQEERVTTPTQEGAYALRPLFLRHHPDRRFYAPT